MEKENNVITIDEQIEAMTDMLPLIAKGDQPKFEAIIESLKFAKNSVFMAKGLMISLDSISQPEPENIESWKETSKQSEAVFTEFGTKLNAFTPTWAKDLYASESFDDIIFSEDYIPGHENQDKNDEPEAEKITAGQVVFRKSHGFKSGVPRFYVDICASTTEDVECFEKIKFSNAEDRDKEYQAMIDEYPEGLTVEEYKTMQAEKKK